MRSVEVLAKEGAGSAGVLGANGQGHVNPDLLASICHDLKAPLASIVMGAGFLKQVVSVDNAAALRVVDAIRRASDRMTQLIVSFSDLAKLEMHDLTLDIRPYDVEAIVRTAVEQFLPEATAQGVPVHVEIGTDVPTQRLSCDRDRILQIFRHLTTCALRVVPEGGTIAIRVDAETAGLARVELEAKAPTGADSRRIATEPSKPDLAIARGLIELHGGRLAVVGDENSLSFTFTLRNPVG
jgi:two-component system, OmpR family, phosphate regulon sensor histidine kinase PhoR